MKNFVCLSFGVMLFLGAVQAGIYNFNGYLVDVDAWAGSGSNETILVVDWNRLDYGAATVSESHAFGFRWNGEATEYDMLTAFKDAGVFDFSVNDYSGTFYLNDIIYNDGQESGSHQQIQLGSWNLASTDNPYDRWGSWGDSEWDFNQSGVNFESLVNGQFEGINAIYWQGANDPPAPADADLTFQLDVPIVPEPASMTLLVLGSMIIFRKRSA